MKPFTFVYKHIYTYTPIMSSEWKNYHEQYSLVTCGARRH